MYSTLRIPPRPLGWLLDNLVARTANAESAVLLTADGVLRDRSRSIDDAFAERLAAAGSGFMSLAGGVCKGGTRQIAVELDEGYLLVVPAAYGTRLMVLAGPDADVDVIGHEMAQLVKEVKTHIGAAPRTAPGSTGGTSPSSDLPHRGGAERSAA